MKVYVDFEDLDEKTFTNNALIYINRKKDIDYVEQIKIQSLADYTKQVRKGVCEEIRKFAYDTFKEFGVFDDIDLEHILDQIQGND